MQWFHDRATVYWDLEDFPVPVGRCVKSFRNNITKVLGDLGYCGSPGRVFAYPSYDKLSVEVDNHFESSQICLSVLPRTKFERHMCILTKMLSFARGNLAPSEEYNFIVIAKDTPDDGDKEFVTALSALITFGWHVFLAVPDDLPLVEMPPLTMATRVWYWSDLFDGKSPIQRIGVVEPESPWLTMQKQLLLEALQLSDGSGGCDISDFSDDEEEDDDDGFLNKREKRMPPDEEEDDCFPNKREKNDAA